MEGKYHRTIGLLGIGHTGFVPALPIISVKHLSSVVNRLVW